MGDRMHRRALGPHFSEAARLCWVALQVRGWKFSDLARETELQASVLHRILYGDRKPVVAAVVKIHEVLGVEVSAWTQKPCEVFVPPGADMPAATGTDGP